ncbi:MAG TPA: hypothetical protein VFW96_12565 [Thermomicrobiales bacterium]|nr:hypothetical protein [Thermomicrobiales bacterium]
MNFDEARAEYNRLRQGYENRQLGPEDFARQVQGLQVRDDGGAYWAIDGATGNWLRYDGQSWVPGQPPVQQHYTPPPAATPTYGQDQTVVAGTPPGGYAPASSGYAPAGGYGPAAGGYGGAAAPQVPGVAVAKPRSKAKPIIAGCLGVVVVVALICVGLGIAFRGAIGTALDTTTGITDVVVAGSIDKDNKPLDSASQFANGQKVYITYTFKRMKQGQQVKFHVARDGQPVELPASSNTFTASQDATYNGVFEFTPARAGNYTVDFYIDDATTPDKTASFTVR